MTIALLVIPGLLAALWGWHSGALRVVSRLSVLVLAYALTWQETGTLAHYLTEQQWLPGVFVWPVAAGTLFIGGSVMFSLCVAFFLHVAPEEWERGGKGFGAGMGGILGMVIGLFLVWTVGVLQDSLAKRQQAQTAAASPTDTAPGVAAKTTTRSATDQLVHDFATQAVSGAATAILGDSPSAELAGEILRSPLSVGEGFKHLAEQPDLRSLLQDPQSYAALIQSSPEDIMQLPHFRALVADTDLMHFLASTGLAGETPAERELDLAIKLSTYARNFEQLRLTPEYQALAADPNFQSQLKSGQWLALLANDKARELAEMLVNPDTTLNQPTTTDRANRFTVQAPGQTDWATVSPAEQEAAATAGDSNSPLPTKSIYRWRDSNGRTHLTDEKPAEGIPYDTLVQ